MNPGHEGVRCGGQNGEGSHFTDRSWPELQQAAHPEGLIVRQVNQVGLFLTGHRLPLEKGVGRDKDTALPEGLPEQGFDGGGFGLGVDRFGQRVGDFGPGRNQPPQREQESALAGSVSADEGCHLARREVVARAEFKTIRRNLEIMLIRLAHTSEINTISRSEVGVAQIQKAGKGCAANVLYESGPQVGMFCNLGVLTE